MAPKSRNRPKFPRKTGLEKVEKVDHSTSPRRPGSKRLLRTSTNAAADEKLPLAPMEQENNDPADSEESESEQVQERFELDGVVYASYQEMVDAKRQKNLEFMASTGLLNMERGRKNNPQEHRSGCCSRRSSSKAKAPQEGSRQSKRLKGEKADGLYVEDERAGKFSIHGMSSQSSNPEKEAEFYGGRINDGSDMTIGQAVKAVEEKWRDETADTTSIPRAQALIQALSGDSCNQVSPTSKRPTRSRSSPKSVVSSFFPMEDGPAVEPSSLSHHVMDRMERLTLGGMDQEESGESTTVVEATVKVVPDRIYSIATHPSTDRLVVSAGDKLGYVGFWHITSRQHSRGNSDSAVPTESDSTHLFRIHTRPVTSMEWSIDGESLLTTSYDGTCRLLNVQTQTFEQVFASYEDDNTTYAKQPGYGLGGSEFWFQSSCLDHRQVASNSFFLSTSVGSVLHVDLRTPQRLTWNHEMSEKKINTVSLHPNGHSFLSSGLDGCVKLWDLRKLGNGKKPPSPLSTYTCARSINSAYFSPVSGQHVLVTKMNRGIDILYNFHLTSARKGMARTTTNNKGKKGVVEWQELDHDNTTGRWLSTFMARWHPALDDIFVVGSMDFPRNVHVYSTRQRLKAIPGLSAVVSRCCFHPSLPELILVGGNSSGRVSVFREQDSPR